MRVAIPCVVVSFNPVAQTVVVQPAIMEKMNKNENGTPVPTDYTIPQLLDVPVQIYGAGGLFVTIPIQPGDECLVVFADMCIDSWWQNGGTNNTQAERRRHDLSDAIAIFGLKSQPNVLDNYNTEAMEIRDQAGQTVIQVSPTALSLTTLGTLTLNGQSIVIEGPTTFTNTVDISGAVSMESTLEVTGEGIVDGVAVKTHVHSGVATGGSDTGPPV